MHNNKVHIFDLFPTPLYVTTYEGDTTDLIKYFDSMTILNNILFYQIFQI